MLKHACFLLLAAAVPAAAAELTLAPAVAVGASDPGVLIEVKSASVASLSDGRPAVAILQKIKSEEMVDWKLPAGKPAIVFSGKLALGGDERIPLIGLPSGDLVAAMFIRDRKGVLKVGGVKGSDQKSFSTTYPQGKMPRECVTMAAGPETDLYFAFVEEAQGGNGDVVFARGRGEDFFTIVADKNCCPCCRPALAVRPDGSALLAYREELAGDVRDIYLRRVTPGKDTPTKPYVVSDAVRVSTEGYAAKACPMAGPAVIAPDDHLVLVAYTFPTDGALKVARSIDGGAKFMPPVKVGNGKKPTMLALADGAVALVYDAVPDGVMVVMSKDGGMTWGEPLRLDGQGRGVAASGSSAAATPDGKAIYATWVENQGKTRTVMLRRGALE